MLVFDPLAVLLLIAANMNLKKPEKESEPIVETPPVMEEKNEQVVRTDFEGIKTPGGECRQTGPEYTWTEITTTETPEVKNEHENIEIHHAPGVYEEHKVPVKKLEPKYDYDEPYAFREKENK